tara:strand:+ start:867 stop:1241 length:375 start_codon:yes stop_codon:yes gene_type:complete
MQSLKTLQEQMSGKKKYFPNNWQKFKDAPDELFVPHMFVEVMDWKVAAWELPSNVCCMIREENLETKKVKEYVYQKAHAAEKKVAQLMKKDGIEFTVCTPEQIHFVSQLDIEDYEDDEDEETDD